MHRFLSQVLMNTQGGGVSLLGSIKTVVLPVTKVFTMGFSVASKYINILSSSGRKLLNRVNYSTFSNTYILVYFIYFANVIQLQTEIDFN
jgi:hypothetical protein